MVGVTGRAANEPSAGQLLFSKSLLLGRHMVSRWLFPVVFILVWEAAVQRGFIDHNFFPAPTSLVKGTWADILSGKLLIDSSASFQRVLMGLGIGVIVGVTLGLAMAVWRPIDAMFSVTVQVLRAIPPITWIGFSILWFGLGSRPAIFIIAIGVVFPMLISTYQGVRQVDLIYIRAARNLGAHGWMFFKDVILAAALPSVLTGLRVSIGLAWILMVVGELVAVSTGVGATLMRAQDYNQTDRMLAYMLVIGFYGYLSDLAVNRLSGYLLRWQPRVRD
jgi:ABC-type nitrate/sulfonate/bicarbonate transport system permease component